MSTGCPWLLPLHLCHGNNWTCRTTHTTSPQRKRTRRELLSEVHAKQPLEKWQPQSMWQRRHRNQNRINYANPDETTLSQRVLEQEKTKWQLLHSAAFTQSCICSITTARNLLPSMFLPAPRAEPSSSQKKHVRAH